MLLNLPRRVKLVDVGPRDGLQNEKQPVPAAIKIELVHRLQAAGLKEIEVTSFVSPKWVPQMADNAQVMSGIVRSEGVRYSVLTPNMKGFESALLSKPDEVVVFGAASEAFSQKNINCSIAESMERFAPVVKAARDAGIAVQVGVEEDLVREQLASYLHHRRTGRPLVMLKLAMTIDGFIAAKTGSGGFITGEPARRRVHELRAASDAIVVGAGTVRADDPQLTVRDAPGTSPRRIVLGRAPLDARVHPCTEWSGSLTELLDTLGGEHVLQLMVEGGAKVAASFHQAGLIDRYVFHIAPAIMGGGDAVPAFAGDTAATLADVWRGRTISTQQLGDDVEVVIEPQRSPA